MPLVYQLSMDQSRASITAEELLKHKYPGNKACDCKNTDTSFLFAWVQMTDSVTCWMNVLGGGGGGKTVMC